MLVLEAAETIGGCTTSGALVREAPGHILSPCAADIITMRASTVVSDLDLRCHGYREVEIDPAYVALSPSGASLAFWRDPLRTAAEIRRFSARDAKAFLALMGTLDGAVGLALPLIATNPVRPDPRRLLESARVAAGRPRSLATVLRLAAVSAADAIRERFEHPIVQGAIGMIANFGAPITGGSTGINLMIPAAIVRFGMARPVGGMGILPAALKRCLIAAGGRIRTSARVERVLIERGRAGGVLLRSGEQLTARAVLCATEPHQALTKLLPSGALPDRFARRATRIPCDNDGCAHFKVELALGGRLRLGRFQRRRSDRLDLRLPSALVGVVEEVIAAIDAAKLGRLADPLPFVSIVPTAADPSQAPTGQDTLSLWSGWLPHEPAGGWAAFKPLVERALVAHAARYYEGIEELELGRWVESPEEISARTGVRRGNVYHVDVSLARVGPLRPALGFGGYRTPAAGFYITAAGTHPGPSVSGIPGQQAARVVLRDLREPDSRFCARRERELVAA